MSVGRQFRQCIVEHSPVPVAGTVNAWSAILAKQAGFRAIYLSGSGVASASIGVPDLGITTLGDVLEDTRRITGACDLPLLVDVDTGFGEAFGIARTTRDLIRAGAAAMHIEDQAQAKRCGHRPNKAIVSTREMCDRLKAAVDARTDASFVVMARTDAVAREGIDAAIERASAYVDSGADMIFAEALTSLDAYRQFCSAVDVPVLANMTEFGVTPYLTLDEFASAGIALVLYPLTAFRAMSKAALEAYRALLEQGTQKGFLDKLQTRDETYEILDYHAYEQKLDVLFGQAGEVKDDDSQ